MVVLVSAGTVIGIVIANNMAPGLEDAAFEDYKDADGYSVSERLDQYKGQNDLDYLRKNWGIPDTREAWDQATADAQKFAKGVVDNAPIYAADAGAPRHSFKQQVRSCALMFFRSKTKKSHVFYKQNTMQQKLRHKSRGTVAGAAVTAGIIGEVNKLAKYRSKKNDKSRQVQKTLHTPKNDEYLSLIKKRELGKSSSKSLTEQSSEEPQQSRSSISTIGNPLRRRVLHKLLVEIQEAEEAENDKECQRHDF